jgi:hypothetical protein
VTLQVVLVLPILIIASIAIIEVGFVVTLRQAVYHAATVAAREAAKGGDIDHMVCVVNAILRPHNLAVGDAVGVVLEDVTADPPIVQAGLPTCSPPTSPALNGNEVRVTVCLDLTNYPVSNTLSAFGICAGGCCIRASSVTQKELPPETP